MPPTFNTAPRSPDFVRKHCSSQNPYRLSWAAKDPASFQSFVMLLILNMVSPDRDRCWLPLHGVVASAEVRGVEQDAQDLDVMLRHDASNDHAHDEETNASEQ